MHPLLNIAIKAARRAGDIITRGLDRLDTVIISQKQHNDFVTDVDQRAEQTIINIIRQSYPNHGILAEESGSAAGDDYLWIIDPLDGTRNFIHGIPHFCVSIAVKFKERIEIGLIYDPIRQEIFTAARGEGAKLNDHRIRVTERTNIDGAFLATGLPARQLSKHEDKQLATVNAMVQEAADLRRFGAAALDLAYVAAGRFDGYWEFGLCPWDIAAGILLVKEAGGLITDICGQEDYFNNGSIVAANAKLIKKMLRVFSPLLQ